MNRSRYERHQGKLARCKSDLKASEKLFSSIYKIGSMKARSISLDKTMTAIVQETQKRFDFARVALILMDKTRKKLECRYWAGFTPEQERKARSRPLDIEKDECRETEVAKTGKALIIKNVKEYDNTLLDLKMDRLYNRVSSITAPLRIRKDIIGILSADRDNRTLELTKSEIKLYKIFANQASILIENAMLQEQNTRKIEQLLTIQELSKQSVAVLTQKKLGGLIVRSALKITKGDVSALFLRGKSDRFLNIASRKECGTLAGKMNLRPQTAVAIVEQVAEKGQPFLINRERGDTREAGFIEGLRSELAIPLVVKNRTAGVLIVGSYHHNAFSREDLEILTIFADRIATLIENARLYEEIIEGRNFAENILESSPSGIITVHWNRKIRSINREAEKIFGIRRQSVLGRDVRDIFGEQINDIAGSGLYDQKVVDNRDIDVIGGDGRFHILRVTSSLLKNQREKITDVTIVVHDLTELKKTEEIIRRMDLLSSLGQLSAGLAHEIRNPLASINFNVQMLSKKLGGDDGTKQIFDDTLAGITRINRLVKGINDFARPGTPSFKQGRMTEIIVESLALLNAEMRKRKIDVILDMDDPLPVIAFDHLKIQQVFVNLLINAMDAMPSGGKVAIRSRVEKNRKEGADCLLVSISDTGTGIPSNNLSKIFDPFFTTKAEGTGLGLSIVHKILEQHNAIIETESQEGQGTSFIIRFPVDKDQAGHA